MYCPNCAREIDVGWSACRSCGAPLSSQEAQVTSARRRAKDVGGWLLFFCVITSIVSPVVAVVTTLRDAVSPDWNDLIVIVVGLFTAFVGVNVWMTSKWAFRLLRIYFILLLILGGLVILSALYVWRSGEELSSSDMVAGLRQILFVIIWWPYFNMSQRVKETFGSNL